MADQRFDLSYRGLIAPGADPEHTRQRLTEIFKLSDKGAERLFTGKPVIVKRDVDAATAAQYEKVFAHAGALLTVVPAAVPEPEAQDPDGAATDQGQASQLLAIDTSHLTLAPLSGYHEALSAAPFPDLDLSYLSLVSGDDWTLEDCAPPPTPIPELDLSYLSLEPPPPAEPGIDPRLDS